MLSGVPTVLFKVKCLDFGFRDIRIHFLDILPTAKAGEFLHQPPPRSNRSCCVLHDVRQALLPVCSTVRYVFFKRTLLRSSNPLSFEAIDGGAFFVRHQNKSLIIFVRSYSLQISKKKFVVTSAPGRSAS